MPVVDEPYDFGRIAILGWPVDKLAPEVAGQVIDGARAVFAEAGITLAGGHSIDSPRHRVLLHFRTPFNQ